MNYPDSDVPFTRSHEFKHLHPERRYGEETLIMREYSRLAKRNDEPYYPIGRRDDKLRYLEYKKAVEWPYVRGGIDMSDRQFSIHDGTARQLVERILVGYLPELGKHPEALMALVRPNLKCLGENAASIGSSAPVLKASQRRRSKNHST